MGCLDTCHGTKVRQAMEEKEKDIIHNILSNIRDKNSRNLLLITKSSLNLLLVEELEKQIKANNKSGRKTVYRISSPFLDDTNKKKSRRI